MFILCIFFIVLYLRSKHTTTTLLQSQKVVTAKKSASRKQLLSFRLFAGVAPVKYRPELFYCGM